MHKTPSQIARALRALRNAHRLGLLRRVSVLPGRDACEAALAQFGSEYPGNELPDFPLPQCTRDHCECKFVPVASDKFHRLDAAGKPSSIPPH
jgi:hypothetical protein